MASSLLHLQITLFLEMAYWDNRALETNLVEGKRVPVNPALVEVLRIANESKGQRYFHMQCLSMSELNL